MYLSRRQTLAVVVLLSLSAIGGGILIWRQATRGVVTVTRPATSSAPARASRAEAVVHVCGAVKSPGVYRLPADARVYEAVALAGGALPEADQEALNLAALVRDGEQIRLPRKGEVPPASFSRAPIAARSGAVTAGTAPPKPTVRLPLQLNVASAQDLEAIPGIGPSLAARIVAYRQANGSFVTVEDLLNVSGIGEKTLAKIRPYLLVP